MIILRYQFFQIFVMSFFKEFLPPFIYSRLLKFRNKLDPNYRLRARIRDLKKIPLFGGNDELFKREIQNSLVYGEIGCGQSTYFASNLINIQAVYSVDSSLEWIDFVRENLIHKNKVHFFHIDFGPLDLTKYGRPKSYIKINNLDYYALCVLKQKLHPDFILIDGRFRVFTFLNLILYANKPIRILFDDYTEERGFYKICENIIEPIEKNSRQALFLIDDTFILERNPKEILEIIEKFRFVME